MNHFDLDADSSRTVFRTIMAKLDINQVTVRRATHTDCDGIKGIIRDLYEGNDRFLYYFHRDLNLGTTFPYVAEISGKIVAYTCGQVIEDGELMITREGRVSEKLQGKSVINKVTSVLIQAALAKFPNLQKLTWTSGHEALCKEEIAKHPYIKMVLHGSAEIFQIHTNTLKALCETDLFRQLEEKYPIDAVTAVPKREALRLLTEEIRFLDYTPTRPIIGWQPSGWHRSTLAPELQVTDLFITRSSPGSKIEAFSFLTTSRNDNGPRIEVIVYCSAGGRSTELVIAYLLHGIREIATLHIDTHMACSFLFPSHIDKKAVLSVLKGQLGIASNENYDYSANMLEFKLSNAAEMKNKL